MSPDDFIHENQNAKVSGKEDVSGMSSAKLQPFSSRPQCLKQSSAVSNHLGMTWVNTMRLRQNGRHFPDNIFKCIFLNENVKILIKISLKIVPKCPINNIPALFRIMAWHRPGDKPLSEPMMDSLLMHISVTGPQWVNCHPASGAWRGFEDKFHS